MGSTYVQNPPYFEGMTKEPKPITGHRQRAHPRPLPRFDHHRPHLAGRQHPGRLRRPGKYLLEHQVRGGRLQPVRHPARQPRDHDARHLRQHPHQEPDGAGRGRQRGRGRLHHPPARRASGCSSTTPPCATSRRACRWSSSPARNTAPARRATGPRRARTCSACAPSSPRASSASTARTSSAWAWRRFVFEGDTSWQSLGLQGRRDGHHPRPRRAT